MPTNASDITTNNVRLRNIDWFDSHNHFCRRLSYPSIRPDSQAASSGSVLCFQGVLQLPKSSRNYIYLCGGCGGGGGGRRRAEAASKSNTDNCVSTTPRCPHHSVCWSVTDVTHCKCAIPCNCATLRPGADTTCKPACSLTATRSPGTAHKDIFYDIRHVHTYVIHEFEIITALVFGRFVHLWV